MKFFSRFLILLTVLMYGACSELFATDVSFSRFALRVRGEIIDYRLVDVNEDAKKDAFILSSLNGKTSIAVFIHSWSGFSSDPSQEIFLPSDVIAVDVVQLASNARALCILTDRALSLMPIAQGRVQESKQRTLIEGSFSRFDQQRQPMLLSFHHRDVSRNRTLFFLPSSGSISIYSHERAGRADQVQTISSGTSVPLLGAMDIENPEGHRSLDGFHFIDLNADGRIDFLNVNTRGCQYFFQQEDGSYPTSASGTCGVSESQRLRYLFVGDTNADGVPDVALFTSDDASLLSTHKTTVNILVGVRGENGKIHYRGQADRQWKATGVHVSAFVTDYNGDAIPDLVITKATYSLGNIVSAIVGSKTKLQVEFYKNSRGEFSSSPDAIREVMLPGKIYDEPEFSPVVVFGDVNGDNRRDCILGEENALACYAGSPNRTFEIDASGEAPMAPLRACDAAVFRIDQDNRDDICITERRTHPGYLRIFLAR